MSPPSRASTIRSPCSVSIVNINSPKVAADNDNEGVGITRPKGIGNEASSITSRSWGEKIRQLTQRDHGHDKQRLRRALQMIKDSARRSWHHHEMTCFHVSGDGKEIQRDGKKYSVTEKKYSSDSRVFNRSPSTSEAVQARGKRWGTS